MQLEDFWPFAIVGHLIGVAVGVGSATVSDVLFFRFLKDYRISRQEERVLNVLHPLFWGALVLLVLTGAVLYLHDAAYYAVNPRFQLKVIVVTVIMVNGLLLNVVVSPRLRRISFGGSHTGHHPGELHHLRHMAFALGAISITSWYSALVLGALGMLRFTFAQGIAAYLALLTIAITVSQVIEWYLRRRARS